MANANDTSNILSQLIQGLHNFAFGNQPLQNAAAGTPQGGPPAGTAPNPMTPSPAPVPQGSANPILAKISGMLGGGNPLEDQKNAYTKGMVDQYMAQNGHRLLGKNATAQAPTRKTAQAQPDPSSGIQGIFHNLISKLSQ